MTEHVIQTKSGHRISFGRFGNGEGRPVLYCHGTPSCRFEPQFIDQDLLSDSGLDLVAPDRPGIGRSDAQPTTFVNWVPIALSLVDELGWTKFSVIGNSGGTGFACALAAHLPDRVERLVLLSSAWRMDSQEARDGLTRVYALVQRLAKWAPRLLALMFKLMDRSQRNAQDGKEMGRFLAPPDLACMQSNGRAKIGHRIMVEALRQGSMHSVREMQLYLRDWGFALDQITCSVLMLHGEQDRNAPIAMANALATHLPNCQFHRFPAEAHLSTLCNQFSVVADFLRGQDQKEVI